MSATTGFDLDANSIEARCPEACRMLAAAVCKEAGLDEPGMTFIGHMLVLRETIKALPRGEPMAKDQAKDERIEELEGLLIPREEVRGFALAMEERLVANDHKEGWSNDTPSALLRRLHEEVSELRRALRHGATSRRIIQEAADVANFAMMVADVVREEEGCEWTAADPK